MNKFRPDSEAVVAGEHPPRIEPGEYQAICYKTETGVAFGGRRNIYIRFRIVGDQNDGLSLYMACTYPLGKMSRRHKYYEQWMLATGRAPHKGEHLAQKNFKGKLYRVLVRNTNRKFDNGRLKPIFMQYSVVDTIIETLTGNPEGQYLPAKELQC